MFVLEEEPKGFCVGIEGEGPQGKQGLLLGLLARG